MTETWQQLAAEKQKQVASKIPAAWRLPTDVLATISEDSPTSVISIPRSCGILSEKDLDITESFSAVELLKRLANGEFTAVDVTEAFCKRAAIAQQLVCTNYTIKSKGNSLTCFIDQLLYGNDVR
jgi:amidase